MVSKRYLPLSPILSLFCCRVLKILKLRLTTSLCCVVLPTSISIVCRCRCRLPLFIIAPLIFSSDDPTIVTVYRWFVQSRTLPDATDIWIAVRHTWWHIRPPFKLLHLLFSTCCPPFYLDLSSHCPIAHNIEPLSLPLTTSIWLFDSPGLWFAMSKTQIYYPSCLFRCLLLL